MVSQSVATKIKVHFGLGRVSNLPTVFSNILVGFFFLGANSETQALSGLLAFGACAYIGGMYLNDWFDSDWDQTNRNDRPIAQGLIGRHEVGLFGFLFLALSVVAWMTAANYQNLLTLDLAKPVAALLAMILFYNAFHKGVSFAPISMALCRVFLVVAASFLSFRELYWSGIGVLMAIGLSVVVITLVAKSEHQKLKGTQRFSYWPLMFAPAVFLLFIVPMSGAAWVVFSILIGWLIRCVFVLKNGQIKEAVTGMIAALALLDGIVLAGIDPLLGAACVALFGLTISLQRWIAGT